MSLNAIHKRGKAIALLLRKQGYEKEQQLKQYQHTRSQQEILNAQLEAMQAEINQLRSVLAQAKPLYVDEIVRLQNYLDLLGGEQSKVLMELLKVNGTCQKQLADLRKNQARTNALERREDDCRLEARREVEKFQQNSLDEAVLSKFHRLTEEHG